VKIFTIREGIDIMPVLTVDDFVALETPLLEMLRSLVEAESPTDDKPSVDGAGELAATLMEARGAKIDRQRRTLAGDHWIGRWGEGQGGVLLMCHLDTVHPLGTLASFPWRIEGRRAYGPGVMDMKGGLALVLTAVEALGQAGRLPERPITLLCTSDEETGSNTSRQLIESLAVEHQLVLCFEPGMPDGSVKTWRKGIGDFLLRVHGRPAHAGVEPEKGINAILEMVRQIQGIEAWGDLGPGVTVTPTVIAGGTATNVVPAMCEVKIDVRVMTIEQQAGIDAAFQALEPVTPGARLDLEGGWNRPPMERTESIAATFERVREIASSLGLSLTEGGTGGGSDANFVAPLGVPVLDGLGPVGWDAHTTVESLDLDSLAPRAAILAGILTDW
jgi:glutamate carboxypeptidase